MSAVLYETRGPVAFLTLNRPAALNSLDRSMIDGLVATTAQAAADDAVGVIVVRGTGDHFMAGGDLKWFREEIDGRHPDIEAQFQRTINEVHTSTKTLRATGKPVIVAEPDFVEGLAAFAEKRKPVFR